MFHEPSDVGILRPIIVRGGDAIPDGLIEGGTFKECVSYPDLPGGLAVQPLYRYVSEPMPVARITPIDGLEVLATCTAKTLSTKG